MSFVSAFLSHQIHVELSFQLRLDHGFWLPKKRHATLRDIEARTKDKRGLRKGRTEFPSCFSFSLLVPTFLLSVAFGDLFRCLLYEDDDIVVHFISPLMPSILIQTPE